MEIVFREKQTELDLASMSSFSIYSVGLTLAEIKGKED